MSRGTCHDAEDGYVDFTCSECRCEYDSGMGPSGGSIRYPDDDRKAALNFCPGCGREKVDGPKEWKAEKEREEWVAKHEAFLQTLGWEYGTPWPQAKHSIMWRKPGDPVQDGDFQTKYLFPDGTLRG